MSKPRGLTWEAECSQGVQHVKANGTDQGNRVVRECSMSKPRGLTREAECSQGVQHVKAKGTDLGSRV